MQATSMHFAFLNAKSVTMKTPLGKRIISTAVAHHEKMETELKRANEIARIRKEVFATPRAKEQTTHAFILWAGEEVCRRMKEADLN